MTFIRVEPDSGPPVDILPGGSQIVVEESPLDLLTAIIARLKASNRVAPAREKSLAITHAQEALHWLEALGRDEAER